MPGLVVFRRRWSAGSDDLVVPGAILLIIHLLSLVMVLTSLTLIDYNNANAMSIKVLIYHQFGYLIILSLSICTELAICVISMRGSILDTEQRTSINAWIYTKSVILLIDIIWLILGSWALVNYYQSDVVGRLRKLFLGVLLTNWALVMVTIITVWCSFDMAGRSWVKMKKYQRSMRDSETRLSYRRSNSINRNWRQRKVMRAYQDSWNQRCRLLFCCIGSTERSRNSFTDIARLLSDFFRELDVVPSDVVAGLVLLRKFQRLEREAIIRQRKNGTYEFLSGVPITDRTKFLALNDPKSYDFFQTVIHYMYFAQGAYGWPLYLYQYRSRVHHLLSEMRCFGCCHNPYGEDVQIIQDNCCYCNYAALKKTLQVGDVEIIYVTYHVDVGETPFFVAIDYSQKKIVITIRGTLSMKDVLTDLNAESEVLPINPPRDDWLGHKGMVQAAIYIRNKLLEEDLIQRSFNKDRSRNTHTFGLVLVGHSLGAGTAAILAVLLKPDYPSIQCFCYSPPGGLLSIPVVEYSKSFITSVVLGKDVIPRIGLYQMEALRSDLINVIQRSIDPKWKTISCSMVCCGCGPEPTSVIEMSAKDSDINKYQEERDSARLTSTHPTDSSIALTIHQPLYPPGRIIHIVRHHPKPDEQKYERSWRNVLNSREPVFQAIWADTTDFDEVLISPVMLQDHMPDEVLAALKKVISASGPRKPHRQTSNTFNMPYNNDSIKCDEDNVNCVYDNDGDDNFNIVQLSKNDMAKNATLSATSYDISVNLNSNLSNFYLGSPYANQNNPILNQQFKCTNDSNIMNGKVTIDNLTSSKSLPSSSSSLSIPSTPSSSNISQYSSVECNTSSVVINDTVTQKIIIPPFMVSPEAINETGLSSKSSSFTITRNATCKTVAFDVNDCIQTNNGKSNKFMKKKCGISDDILQRQSSERLTVSKCHQSSLHVTPQTQRRRASIAPNHLDLTYDEWFGFAPLASPETLSEISSISSRNSIRNMSNNNITNNNKSNNSNNNNINNNNNYNNNNSKLYTKSVLDDIFESQLHTPTVLRRAPKFIENLSTCAEDSRNLDQYKRMSRVIRKTQSKYKKQPFKFSSRSEIEKSINNNDTNANYDCHDIDNDDDDNDNDDDDADDDGEDDTDSFETAKSFKHSNGTAPINKLTFNENERENSKSADQLDELRPSSSSSRPFEYGYEQKLTCSDSNILNDNDNNEQFNCCNMNDINHIERIITKEMCLSGSGDITYYSANSSIERVACSTQTNIIGGLLESHFPIQDEYQQLQHQQQQQQQQQHRYQYQFTTNDIPLKKKEKRNQKCLLGQTDETNYSQVVQFTGNYYKNSPPTNRKRKACVYPLMTTTATIITTETITTTTEKPKQIISSSSSSSSSPLTVQSKITETSTSTTSATTAITTTSTAAAPVKVGVSVISKQSTVHIPSSGYMYKSHNESSV